MDAASYTRHGVLDLIEQFDLSSTLVAYATPFGASARRRTLYGEMRHGAGVLWSRRPGTVLDDVLGFSCSGAPRPLYWPPVRARSRRWKRSATAGRGVAQCRTTYHSSGNGC